jgi:hypothetical protein
VPVLAEHAALGLAPLAAEPAADAQLPPLGAQAVQVGAGLGPERLPRGSGTALGSSSACPVVNHPASVRGAPSRGLPVNHRQARAPGARRALCIQSGMFPR